MSCWKASHLAHDVAVTMKELLRDHCFCRCVFLARHKLAAHESRPPGSWTSWIVTIWVTNPETRIWDSRFTSKRRLTLRAVGQCIPHCGKCVFHTTCGNPETQATQGQQILQPVPRNEDINASANQSTKDSLMEPKRLPYAALSGA